MEKTVHIILVEDDFDFAKNVKDSLKGLTQFKLIEHYTSCELAFKSEKLVKAEILLLDIKLPGINGLEAIPKFLEINPKLNIIVLTTFNHDKKLFTALQEGAKGYLLKTDYFIHLENALTEVKQGGMLFSPEMAQLVLKYFRRKVFKKIKLTKREKEVLQHLKEGLCKKEISGKMMISYGTVDSHVKSIYKKLNVNSNVQAAQVASKVEII